MVTALAGLAEDVLLLQIVAPGTDGEDLRRADLVGAASWLTRIKLAALAVAIIAVLAGAVTLAFAGTNRF